MEKVNVETSKWSVLVHLYCNCVMLVTSCFSFKWNSCQCSYLKNQRKALFTREYSEPSSWTECSLGSGDKCEWIFLKIKNIFITRAAQTFFFLPFFLQLFLFIIDYYHLYSRWEINPASNLDATFWVSSHSVTCSRIQITLKLWFLCKLTEADFYSSPLNTFSTCLNLLCDAQWHGATHRVIPW